MADKITISDNKITCPIMGDIDSLLCASCKCNALGTFVENSSICTVA